MSSADTRPAHGPAAEPAGQQPPPAERVPRGRTAALAASAVRIAPVLLPAVLVVVLGLWGLARHSGMGNDEVATRWAAGLSLRGMAHLLRHIDAVHGLYYLLMHCWLVIGSSPAILRVPSVIGMAVAVALAAVIARRLTRSALAGLFAGLIMALTPSISFYSQTARSYALVLACVLGATLALLRALAAEAEQVRATRRWLAYGALVVLAAYLNEMSLLALAAHAVTVWLSRCDRGVLKRWAETVAAAVVVALPLIALSIIQSTAVSFIPTPGLAAIDVQFHDYFGPSIVVALILVGCAVVAVLPSRLGPAEPAAAPGQAEGPAWGWTRDGVSLPSLALPLLLLPVSLLVIESLIVKPLYLDRYVLYGEAGAALLAGAGVARLGRWLARPAGGPLRHGSLAAAALLPGVVVCVLTLLLQLSVQQFIRNPWSRQYNFGPPSLFVGEHAEPGDGVLYMGTLFRKAELGYPADFRNVTDFAVAETPAQTGDFRGTDKPTGQVLELMPHYHRIWVFTPAPPLGPPSIDIQQENAALSLDFTVAARQQFRGMAVTLWVRR